MKSGFWKSDWLLGVLVVVAFTAANLLSDWIPSLERKAYDVALRSTARAPSDRIAIIAIDQQSIDNIGRWPWSRDVHARMLDLLSKANAKTIGYLVFFAEPENERIALAQEFEADELADVKARFFREAETAGRLSRPNIVTIYDTGEEFGGALRAAAAVPGKAAASTVDIEL